MHLASKGFYTFVALSLLAACDPGSSFPSHEGADNPAKLSKPGAQGGTSGLASSGSNSGGSDSGATAAEVAMAGFAGIPLARPPAVSVHGQLRVEGTQLLDEQGALVQLKGPSSMWLNWENTGYAKDPDGVRFLRDNWGASLIRAAMGVDASGAYLTQPEKAKTEVRAIVDLAIELGIYVIIDWHDHAAETHQEQAVEFFTQMATEYGDYPNVIYETYNEPLEVDWNADVKPYHEAVVAAIRAIDPDNVIVLGTPNWSQYVYQAATNPVEGTNLMYTLHFYSCSHTASLRKRADHALAKGLPIFVTEWGATNADGGTTGELCLEEAQLWTDWMKLNNISWAAWKLDDCADLSCYFKPRTSTKGNWTDAQLNGHAPFVRDRMRE